MPQTPDFNLGTPFVVIYRTGLPAPSEPRRLAKTGSISCHHHPGPLEFRTSTMVTQRSPGAVAVTCAYKDILLPRDSYLTFEGLVEMWDGKLPQRRDVTEFAAEVATLLELHGQGLIIERSFEGFVVREGRIAFYPEEGVSLTAYPAYDPEEVMRLLPEVVQRLNRLGDADRFRFRLSARWFDRGTAAAATAIDQFLCYWTVLEVFPAMGTSDVVERTVELLHQRHSKCPSPSVIKRCMWLGPMAGLRGRVFHDGAALVSQTGFPRFNDYLTRLRACASAAIRAQLGLPIDDTLDEFLGNPESPPVPSRGSQTPSTA